MSDNYSMTPASSGNIYNSTSPLEVKLEGSTVPITDLIIGTSQPVTLSWRDVNAYIESTDKKCCKKGSQIESRQILQNVNGIARPGAFLAIMGASGAGKSTLMNVLNQRNTKGLIIEGDVYVNGATINRKTFASISAYVQQDDMFIPLLKVKEHLWLQSVLRINRSVPDSVRKSRVDEIIRELGLTQCANTIIGQPGVKKGISGGERKRLAFASEVFTNPSLMFCDEPTSGLDSFMAESVVQTLKSLSAKGKTIISTIHQPSSEVFALFDELLVIACGRIAYMGPAHHAKEFFNRIGYQCPENYNPADFYIHTLAIKPGKETECQERVKAICDQYDSSVECDSIRKDIKETSAKPMMDDLMVDIGGSGYKASWCKQFQVLLWRSGVTSIREPFVTRLKIAQAIFMGLLFGLVFLRQDYNQKGVMNINGALFLLEVQVTFNNLFSVVLVFPLEYPVFIREHKNRMYRVSTYFLSKMLTELPLFLLVPAIITSIMYWMIGLYEEVAPFFICIAVLILVSNVATSYAYLLGCSTGSVNLSLVLMPPVIIPLMMFGGFFLNSGSVPVYFIWLEYLSWFKYCNEILIVNQWRYVTNITCEYILPVVNGTLSMAQERQQTSRCFSDGKQVIESLSFNEDNIYTDIYALLALMVGFRLIAFLAILFRASRNK